MSSNQAPSRKGLSPAVLLLVMGALLGLGVFLATRLPQDPTPRSSWVPLVSASTAKDEQIAMAKTKGNSAVDRMLRRYQRRLYLQPKKVDVWVLLGQSWVRKARGTSEMSYYNNAEASVRVALRLAPDHSTALNLQGVIYIQQHQFKKAIELTRQILKMRPKNAMAWGTLSDAHLERGEYKQAADAVEKMINIKPNLPSYIRAAHIMWLRGNVQGARKLIEHAYDAGRGMRDREPVAWVLSEGATMFWHIGNLKEADQGFDMALQYVPDYPPALVGKAQIAMARDNPKLAIQLLENAYNQRPLAKTAWLLGDARAMAGDKQGARKAYRIVEKLGQDDRRVLALFWSTKNIHNRKALRLIREEYKVRADIYTEDVVAWTLYRLGRFKEALKRINRATHLDTVDARLLFHKGAILIASGRVREGRTLVQRALKVNPHFDWTAAKEARLLLQRTPSPAPASRPTSRPSSRPTQR